MAIARDGDAAGNPGGRAHGVERIGDRHGGGRGLEKVADAPRQGADFATNP